MIHKNCETRVDLWVLDILLTPVDLPNPRDGVPGMIRPWR